MGEEIGKAHFTASDFEAFQQRMHRELAELRSWEQSHRFDQGEFTTGLELEAWLLDTNGHPVPENTQFLESLNHESVVPELARFNFELNVQPQPVAGDGLARMQQELQSTWQLCGERAAQLGQRITCIGILPTVTETMLCAQNMTPRSRFAALNRQVLRMRHGEPLRVSIEGIDSLQLQHNDVMFEAAATSLQVHLKVPLQDASRYFNAFVIASAATVALAANAPLVFGKRLWHDSRIAMFEQAVDTGQGLDRVSFGRGYAPKDFLALFDEKVRDYPPLLPVELPDWPMKVPHVRLHNGTLWFWNRPLIGFEEDGAPHVRIEHRVMSAGPTAIDMFANVALSLGLAQALASHAQPPERQIDFATARSNFYASAQHGLQAEVQWLDQHVTLRQLLETQWLKLTEQGLQELKVRRNLIDQAMETLNSRVTSGQTGAKWQLDAYERHRGNLVAIVEDYLAHQATHQPVHSW